MVLFSAACSQSNGFSIHRNGTTTNGVTNGVSRHTVLPPATSPPASSPDMGMLDEGSSGSHPDRKRYGYCFFPLSSLGNKLISRFKTSGFMTQFTRKLHVRI